MRARGQALVEAALVFPVLCALLLTMIEVGALGAHVIAWQGLAVQLATAAAVSGDIPVWWADEAARATCGAASVSLDAASDPLRVVLTCQHSPWAVSGFEPLVTVEGIAAHPSSTEAPSTNP